MSKQKGALRYTDKESGRPVLDIPKDMLAAHLGMSRSATSRRAESRWMQGATGAGKGDMPRPRDTDAKDRADAAWDRAFCQRDASLPCECFECRNGRG